MTFISMHNNELGPRMFAYEKITEAKRKLLRPAQHHVVYVDVCCGD